MKLGYGSLFIAMCDMAKTLQREWEIILALSRLNMIWFAADACDEAVRGLRLIGFRLDTDHMVGLSVRASIKRKMEYLVSSDDDSDSDGATEWGNLIDCSSALIRLDAWCFSEQLARAWNGFFVELGLDGVSAGIIAQFAEAEPGSVSAWVSRRDLPETMKRLLSKGRGRGPIAALFALLRSRESTYTGPPMLQTYQLMTAYLSPTEPPTGCPAE